MSESTAAAPAAPAAPTATEPAAGGNPQATSETDWQAKFEAQQKVNRDLEAKFNGLRDSQSAQSEALAKALGLKPEETSDIAVLSATVSTLQDQFTQSQLANTVLTIAAENGITEQADIDLLRSVKDEATMRTIAARIKSAAPGSDPASPSPGPRPDLTQGASGTPSAGDPATEFAHFLGAHMGR